MRYLLCFLVLTLGCATRPVEPVSPVEQAAYAADRKFARVALGMRQSDVLALLGPPTSQHAWNTWKAFIPMNPGIDTNRYRYHYRGQGRVVFGVGIGNWFQGNVIEIQPDAAEPGD